MKFRIVEVSGIFYPEYKEVFWWRKIPVRLHTWENRYIHYARSCEEAEKAIRVFREQGDISAIIVREVE